MGPNALSPFSSWVSGTVVAISLLLVSPLYAQSESAAVRYRPLGGNRFELCANVGVAGGLYDLVPGVSLDNGQSYAEGPRVRNVSGGEQCFVWNLSEQIANRVAIDVTGRAFQVRVIQILGGLTIRGFWFSGGETVRPALEVPAVWSVYTTEGQLLGRIVSQDGSGGRLAALPVGDVRIVRNKLPGWRGDREVAVRVPPRQDVVFDWVNTRRSSFPTAALVVIGAIAGVVVGLALSGGGF